MNKPQLPLSPRLPLNWWGLLVRIVAAFVILMASNMVRVPLHQLPIARRDDAVGIGANAAIFLLTPLAVVIMLWGWLRFVERRKLRAIGLLDISKILPGILGGTAVVAVPMVVGWVFLSAFSEPVAQHDADPSTAPVGVIVAGVVFVLVRSYFLQGIPEELIYRGWLFSTTDERPVFTVVWTTLAFTVPHLSSSGGQQSTTDFLLYLVLPLGMAVLAGAVVVWKKSVWWAAGTHGGMHAVMTVLGGLVPVVLDSTAWIILGVTQLVTGFALLAWWHSRKKRP
ncbi:lysostaphin resistance A-like protein [Corynebacterium sp. 32222D000AT]|uniref:CPBP family intramembrane glutamic endopeptidase n=1 Tax=unclassified Corynebacterium TaxID=2624378 RepID=UPI002A943D3C|nr:type II CAAX endopeptidase family protein [Mycobacteriaceae bacterium]MDY5829142.1 type II CAAX endopeptidase family protein [Corynebacterium sp.]